MAVYCQDLSLLFIQNPRTGCSAVGRLLAKKFGGEYLPSDPTRRWGHFKHAALSDLLERKTFNEEQLAGLFKFSTVRNPFDSIASLYQKRLNWASLTPQKRRNSWWWGNKKVRKQVRFVANHSFEEFVNRWIDIPNRPKLTDRLDGVDFVMRFERLQDDFSVALDRAGVDRDALIPMRNSTPNRRAYRDYYTAGARMVVERVYAADLAKYGYGFDKDPEPV